MFSNSCPGLCPISCCLNIHYLLFSNRIFDNTLFILSFIPDSFLCILPITWWTLVVFSLLNQIAYAETYYFRTTYSSYHIIRACLLRSASHHAESYSTLKAGIEPILSCKGKCLYECRLGFVSNTSPNFPMTLSLFARILSTQPYFSTFAILALVLFLHWIISAALAPSLVPSHLTYSCWTDKDWHLSVASIIGIHR